MSAWVNRKSWRDWLQRLAAGVAGTVLTKVIVALLVPVVMDTELVETGKDMINGCSTAPTRDGEGAE